MERFNSGRCRSCSTVAVATASVLLLNPVLLSECAWLPARHSIDRVSLALGAGEQRRPDGEAEPCAAAAADPRWQWSRSGRQHSPSAMLLNPGLWSDIKPGSRQERDGPIGRTNR